MFAHPWRILGRRILSAESPTTASIHYWGLCAGAFGTCAGGTWSDFSLLDRDHVESAVDVARFDWFLSALRAGGSVVHGIFCFCGYLQTVARITRSGLLELLLGCFAG